ncbi:MAG: GAF domain-containing protein [Opitutales bacterium]
MSSSAEVQTQERAFLDALYRISSLAGSSETPQEALNFILDEVKRVLKASSATVSLINPDSNRLEIEVARGLPPEKAEMDLPLGVGVTGWVALHGQPLLVPDVRVDNRYIPVRPSVRSEMAVPMEEQGVVIGVVNVDSEQVDAFDGDALKMLRLMTNEAGRVVSKLWLINQLKIKAEQLQVLINVGQNLVGKLEEPDILVGIAREARRLIRCRLSAVYLYDADRNRLSLSTLIDEEGSVDEVAETIEPAESSMGVAIQRLKTVEVHDLARTEETHFVRLTSELGLASMLTTPIVYENEVIGLLNAYTASPHRFNNDEKRIFSTLARFGALAIQNARLYGRVFASEESLRKNEKLTTLGLLAAEIAHEIRNPLTVIKLLFGALDLSFDEKDARRKDVQIITEKLDQLEDIVGRVLEFGKARQSMHARWNLVDILQDTLRLVRLKIRQSGIYLESIPEQAPLWIDGHKGQLQQVLLNLILNAVEAMPNGGHLKFTFIETERDGQPAVGLDITDTGSGVPSEIQGEIFDSFLTGRKDGTGLGLAVSKRILRSHRGDLLLHRSDDSGSTFRILLPVVDPQG